VQVDQVTEDVTVTDVNTLKAQAAVIIIQFSLIPYRVVNIQYVQAATAIVVDESV
jgi:hypothetical protein